MNNYLRNAVLWFGINGALFSTGAAAQAVAATQPCQVDEITPAEVQSRFKTEMQTLLSADLQAKKQDDVALFKSVGAPPSAEGSRLVDGASFTDVLAIAVENEFLKEADGQTSIQITPFAFNAAFHPEIVNDPDRYNSKANRWARSFALTFATGGTGEKFDRTGDGVVDDPLKAGDFNDIQTWELKYRLFGSDDWKENLVKIRDEGGDPTPSAMEFAALNLGMKMSGVVAASTQCVKESLFVIYLKSAGAQASLLKLAQLKRDQNAALSNVFKTIAKGWRGSIVAATTQQEPEFGQDKWSAGFRASWGVDARGVNLNLDYSEAKGRAALPDPNSWKVGAEYVTYLWKGKLGKKGAKAGFSAAWEMFDDIPTAKHKDIGKIGLRIEIPIAGSDSVKLPISVVWANHEDALTDADSVRAHIGFTVDFGDAMKKQKADK